MAKKFNLNGTPVDSTLTSDAAVTSVLTNGNDYANTILGQIDRITDAHEVIQKKAIEMALNVKTGQGSLKPTIDTALAQGHKIMDTASAINSINVRNRLLTKNGAYVTGNISVDNNNTYVVPVGYNKTPITIQFSRPTLSGSAEAAHVLSGKTFYNSSYTKVTGTMPNYNGNVLGSDPKKITINNNNYIAIPIASLGYYDTSDAVYTDISKFGTVLPENVLYGLTFTSASGLKIAGTLANKAGNQNAGKIVNYNNTVAFLIPETGKYTQGSLILSTIPYWANGIYQLEEYTVTPSVVITKTTLPEDGEVGTNGEAFAVNSLEIPAGYYPSGLTVKPILDWADESNKVINYTTLEVTRAGTFVPSATKHDFYTSVTVPQSSNYTISRVNAGTSEPGTVLTVKAAVNNQYPIEASKLKFSANTAGWLDTNDLIVNKNVALGTLPKATFAAVNGTVKVTQAGWISVDNQGGTVVGTVKKGSVSLNNITKNGTSQINSNNVTVPANNYYITVSGEAGYLDVAPAYTKLIGAPISVTASENNNNATTVVGTAINSQTVFINVSGNYQPNGTTYKATVKSGTNSTVSVNEVGVNGVIGLTNAGFISGWITANPKLGTRQLPLSTNSNSVSSIHTSNNILDPQVTIIPGDNAQYIPKQTWTGKGIIINLVNAGKGSVGGETIANIAYNTTPNYTPTTDDDTTTAPTYFKSFDLNVNYIISQLMAI